MVVAATGYVSRGNATGVTDDPGCVRQATPMNIQLFNDHADGCNCAECIEGQARLDDAEYAALLQQQAKAFDGAVSFPDTETVVTDSGNKDNARARRRWRDRRRSVLRWFTSFYRAFLRFQQTAARLSPAR